MRRVDTTKHELTCRSTGAQVESEHVRIQCTLVGESSEGCLHSIHRDVVETHTADAIKVANCESRSKTLGVVNLGKSVALHSVLTNRNGVSRVKSRDWATAILDVESGSIGNVSRGLAVLI